MHPIEVAAHILARARWNAGRSSGPGGQRRDKVSTRAEVTIEVASLDGLPPTVVARLVMALGLDERALRITVQDQRLLSRNQEMAARRFEELVVEALRPPPPPRRPTRPSRARRMLRVDEKTRHGDVKRLRRTPSADGL